MKNYSTQSTQQQKSVIAKVHGFWWVKWSCKLNYPVGVGILFWKHICLIQIYNYNWFHTSTLPSLIPIIRKAEAPYAWTMYLYMYYRDRYGSSRYQYFDISADTDIDIFGETYRPPIPIFFQSRYLADNRWKGRYKPIFWPISKLCNRYLADTDIADIYLADNRYR